MFKIFQSQYENLFAELSSKPSVEDAGLIIEFTIPPFFSTLNSTLLKYYKQWHTYMPQEQYPQKMSELFLHLAESLVLDAMNSPVFRRIAKENGHREVE